MMIFQSSLKQSLKKATPLLLSMLFTILFNINQTPFASSSIRPEISIIFIYFWLVNREILFNIISVIIIAVLEEMLTSMPFGVSLIYILSVYISTIAIKSLVINKSFPIFWNGFIMVAFVSMLIKFTTISIYYQEIVCLPTTFFTFLTTIAVFPLFSAINIFFYKYFVQDRYI